jgi:hypothetical protein
MMVGSWRPCVVHGAAPAGQPGRPASDIRVSVSVRGSGSFISLLPECQSVPASLVGEGRVQKPTSRVPANSETAKTMQVLPAAQSSTV